MKSENNVAATGRQVPIVGKTTGEDLGESRKVKLFPL